MHPYRYTKLSIYMSLSFSGPSTLPNNPVSKVLSILYRNYYKNLLPYKRTTEPMAQSGPLSQQKKRSHHIFNEPTNVSSPLQQLSLLLLVHPFSVLEIQDTMTQVALGTDSFAPSQPGSWWWWLTTILSTEFFISALPSPLSVFLLWIPLCIFLFSEEWQPLSYGTLHYQLSIN